MRGSRQGIWSFVLIAALCAAVSIAAPAESATVSTKPQAVKLLINGQKLPITHFGGPDIYNPIKASTLRVVARWKGNITGTGYRIQVSTTEPVTKTWRTCKTGTSCLVTQGARILKGQEYSWTVRIAKVKPHLITVVGGFMVCLIRSK